LRAMLDPGADAKLHSKDDLLRSNFGRNVHPEFSSG
jgi:hypothetical protein